MLNYPPETAIAIIGMSGRFPGADTVTQYWQNLRDGKISIQTFSEEELREAGVPDKLLNHQDYVKAGTIINDLEKFDAAFFGYTPREAQLMDPQHRLFLECAWEALEDASCDPHKFSGLIGVFGGSGFCNYLLNNLLPQQDAYTVVDKLHVAIGNERDSLSSTVSYKLNLKGPSVAVQTFCSTSAVAIHLGCQSLLNYECDLVLAGGVAITIPQKAGYLYEEGGIVSPDGVCRTFDMEANGSVMGNGVGVITLKRLADAMEDKDHVYAVIRGSSMNNDGIVKVGYTAPGLDGQTEVITEALSVAGVPAETIGYIEAHGTATPLGDSVELSAMIKAFQMETDRTQFCAIGSLKPNIGHLDRASGVAGMIKTALSLKHGQLPPSLNFRQANPDLNLAKTPFYVNTTLTKWSCQNGQKRRAGISSFGLGGTNVHFVMEEAPTTASSRKANEQPQLLILSAKSDDALERMSYRLTDFLQENPDATLADIAYTLQIGRAEFNHRRIVVGQGTADVARQLSAMNTDRVRSQVQLNRQRPLSLLLANTIIPLIDIYRTNPRFQALVDECHEMAANLTHQDLRPFMMGEKALSSLADSLQNMAVVLNQFLIANLYEQQGVTITAYGGYGLGEYTAVCLAGGLSIDNLLTYLAGAQKSVVMEVPHKDYLSATLNQYVKAGQSTLSENDWGAILQTNQTALSLLDLVTAHDETYLLAMGEEWNTLLQTKDTIKNPFHGITSLQANDLLLSMGQLWLGGVDIHWQLHHEGKEIYRLPLPTYPFEKQTYWLDAPQENRPSSHDHGKKANISDWFYLPTWQQRPLFATHTNEPQTYLVFVDPTIGEHLAQELERHHHRVYRVVAGNEFTADQATQTYQIHPQQASHYKQLFDDLPSTLTHIIHMWSLMPLPDDLQTKERFDYAQRYGFHSVRTLAQVLSNRIVDGKFSLYVMTANTQVVTHTEQLEPAYATTAGLCRVIPQENLHIECQHIDLALSIGQPAWQQKRLINQLYQELSSTNKSPLTIAYRGSMRWEQTFTEQPLPKPQAMPLQSHGVYLLPGGLGGIGLILCEYLAKTYQAKIVLLGRSDFPALANWGEWLAQHATHNYISRKIRRLQKCLDYGAEILVLQADVAQVDSLQNAVAQAEMTFGAINGILHVAGVSGDAYFNPIAQLTVAQCDAHFQSKAYTTYALAQVFAHKPIDFCLVFSSLSSVLGGLGFAAYAGVNTFLDTFTHQHNMNHDSLWTAVNWDTWQIQVGQHDLLGRTVADFEMLPAEGVKAVEYALSHLQVPQLIVSTGTLQARLDQWVRQLSVVTKKAVHARPKLPTPYAAPTNDIEKRITNIWQEVLGIEPIGLHDNFLELGGNSLLGTQLISRIRQTLQVNLPLPILFEAPTVESLAIAIQMKIIDQLAGLSENEVLDIM